MSGHLKIASISILAMLFAFPAIEAPALPAPKSPAKITKPDTAAAKRRGRRGRGRKAQKKVISAIPTPSEHGFDKRPADERVGSSVVSDSVNQQASFSSATSQYEQYLSDRNYVTPQQEFLAKLKARLAMDPSFLEYRFDNGYSLMHYAVDRNYPEVVKYLIGENMKLNVTDPEGKTPYHLAIEKGHMEIADMLKRARY